MREAILGLDIGTSSTKAVLFDYDGNQLAAARQGYAIHAPQPNWAEQNPEAVWNAVIGVVREVLSARPDAHCVALSLASQSGSVIPLSASGAPLYPMILWLDQRADELARRWQAEGRAEMVRRISGWRLQPGLPLAHIAWLREQRPDIFSDAARFVGVNDFLLYRLTGEFITDLSSSTPTQLADAHNGQWSATLCALAGISVKQLSALVASGKALGPLAPAVSKLTGLPPDTIIVSGGHDQSCTALALGMVEPGSALLAAGSAWVFSRIIDGDRSEALSAGLDVNYHVVPAPRIASQLLGGYGAVFDWWLQLAYGLSQADELPAGFDAAVLQSAAGRTGLYFAPSAVEAAGLRAGRFWGLRLGHTKTDMARAIMEGVAFDVRHALLTMQAVPQKTLWMVGGALRSTLWPQLIADVLSQPVSTSRYEYLAALGAALLAGLGASAFGTPQEALKTFANPPDIIKPDASYDAQYDSWLEHINTVVAAVRELPEYEGR